MSKINDTNLKYFTENISMKTKNAITEPILVDEFLNFNEAFSNFLRTGNAYEVANTIKSFNFWNSNKDKEPTPFKVMPKDVFYVDLGAFNLKYEEGFLHSCLILKKYGTTVLVVPGSSKKYGKTNFLLEDIKSGDGFRDNTGLFIDQIRCVSITRIKGKKIGEVSDTTFKRITDKLIKAYFQEYENEINAQLFINQTLSTRNDELENEIQNLKIINESLKSKLDIFE